jgi:hypothetical protein
VIRITRGLDLNPVDPGSLDLPFLRLGDSDSVEVGDELNIFGYPGIGGETVTFTKGVVSGFSLDAAIEGRAWIKTDATIAGGNSGGIAVDEEGVLVAVPTRAGAGGGAEYVDCRPLADTNGDSRIDDADSCIPVGGFINSLRPVRLAAALIEAARLGVGYEAPGKATVEQDATQAKPKISNLFFSTGVSDDDQPMTIVTSLPPGARSLFLFFDYENMGPQRTLEMKVQFDGKEQPDWGLPPSHWPGGESGSWWLGWSDVDFSEGTYELALYVDGQVLGEAEIDVGERAWEAASFSNVTFSSIPAEGEPPGAPAVEFPPTTMEVMATFDYENMSGGMAWGRAWLVDGQEVLRKDSTWSEGPSGSTSLSLKSQTAFQPGAYRLNLHIEGELAATSSFWVVDDIADKATFGPVRFAQGVDAEGNPVGEARAFDSGLQELYALSAYSGMEVGRKLVASWYVNDQIVVEWPSEWSGDEQGLWHDYIYAQSGKLPDGEYKLELTLDGQVVTTGSTTVGSHTATVDSDGPGPQDGVRIIGTILDLDTERPVPGAVFLVLKPGIELDEFGWTVAEIYTSASADQAGVFRLPLLLERGECYALLAGAEGYWRSTQDSACIDENVDSVLDVVVRLKRK